MTLFTDEEVALFESRTKLNSLMKERERLIVMYEKAIKEIDALFEAQQQTHKELIAKLPEDNVYRK